MIKLMIFIFHAVVFGSVMYQAATENKAVDVDFAFVFDLDTPNTPLSTEALDVYGYALAAGDFNNDGIDDWAVGIPGKAFNGAINQAGSVVIYYGKYNALPTDSVERIQTLVLGMDGVEEGDYFGSSLTVGDFDGDGYDDLVVGVPLEDVTLDFNDPNNSTFVDAGAFNLFYGSSLGLESDSDFFHIDTDNPFSGQLVQANAEFAHALASGDFNHDGYDDLVVSVHKHDVIITNGVAANAGMIVVFNGHPAGITGGNRIAISQNDGALIGAAETGDNFGLSLAVGNFNNDDYDDLAIGVPYEDYNGVIDAGVAQVIYGENLGLYINDEIWAQNQLSGVLLEENDFFGFSLHTADVNGDGFDELIVGAPYEDLDTGNGTAVDAGVVHVIKGASSGLEANGNQTFSQDSGSLFGVAETGDVFGLFINSLDFNLDGFEDLVIGTPYEDTSVNAGGVVHMVFGGALGVDVNDSLHYLSDDLDANLGFSMATGDFGLGQTLHIGKPGNMSSDMESFAGAVFTLVYQNPHIIFEDGFELIGK